MVPGRGGVWAGCLGEGEGSGREERVGGVVAGFEGGEVVNGDGWEVELR